MALVIQKCLDKAPRLTVNWGLCHTPYCDPPLLTKSNFGGILEYLGGLHHGLCPPMDTYVMDNKIRELLIPPSCPLSVSWLCTNIRRLVFSFLLLAIAAFPHGLSMKECLYVGPLLSGI